MYPSFGNLVPRDVASRRAKEMCDKGHGVGPTKLAVYPRLRRRHRAQRQARGSKEKYGNLFDMYHEITGENAYETPMRIYPAVHYTMGGLWVDYNLMSTIPGLYVLGEANFSDHGANRLGASALMQGLADGYFIIPYTIGDYLAAGGFAKADAGHAAFRDAEKAVSDVTARLLAAKGKKTVEEFHRELGKTDVGPVRDGQERRGPEEGARGDPETPRGFLEEREHPRERRRPQRRGGARAQGGGLPRARRTDGQGRPCEREESCGGHFREEYQTDDGEAKRNDEKFAYVAAWEFKGVGAAPAMHAEPLTFEYVKPSQRSYK